MMRFGNEYDIVVIGGGHAGAEAAHAAAKMGLRAGLITFSREKIGEMSCNPAIGGLAKGHIVCEIDALGGLMGLAADATGLQFRMLNRSKGPAVWGPRAQSDKCRYRRCIQQVLADQANIDIIEGEVTEILVDEQRVRGVELIDGRRLAATAVVITTGTFLRGEIHIGNRRYAAGRIGERAAAGLSENLVHLGLSLGRLKTGTCPRLLTGSIDFGRCQVQEGDDHPVPFSVMTDRIDREQVPCHITFTNETTHTILRANLDRAPLYTGQITSSGPRYCPSIETKIVRFAEKDRHQIFLEPESLESDWVYCNGLSTSMPQDVQDAMVRSIVGLERAEIAQYGYAIEYDFVTPDQLWPTLESKRIGGLFFAGQINGTSGYEEAAGQGLMAGINAARQVQGREGVVLGRDQAYIGVLIDDLVTKGVDEPYRMFTSRAEFRLMLRCDTAQRRLTPVGREIGLVDNDRWEKHQSHVDQSARLLRYLAELKFNGATADTWLRRPQSSWQELVDRIGAECFSGFDDRVIRQVVTDIKYAGYEQREARMAEKLRGLERAKLSAQMDYNLVTGLRFESKEKLDRLRPLTLGQASRIAGVNPADIVVLMVHLGKKR